MTASDDPYLGRRRRMVDRQLRRRGIVDERVLEAMEAVPRHEFVPEEFVDAAYDDRPLPIGSGQTISQPYIVARIADLAGLQPSYRVLDVGTGWGYAAAVYAELAREVVSVEIRSDLADQARDRLQRLGYRRVRVMTGDAHAIARSEGPFEVIVVAAAAPSIPSALEESLAPGGRLVVPVGKAGRQNLWLVTRGDDGFERERLEAVAFVPLLGD